MKGPVQRLLEIAHPPSLILPAEEGAGPHAVAEALDDRGDAAAGT
jgi:hypothetical protein